MRLAFYQRCCAARSHQIAALFGIDILQVHVSVETARTYVHISPGLNIVFFDYLLVSEQDYENP
jgi:hypothetical protein